MMKKNIWALLIFICILTGCGSSEEKYSQRWFKTHNVFYEDNTKYFVVDNMSWFEDAGVQNAFSFSISFCGNDYNVEYDLAGSKFGIYSISNSLFGYMNTSNDEKTSYIINEDSNCLPEDSIFLKDMTLIRKIVTTKLSKGDCYYFGIVDGYDTVIVKGNGYRLVLYLDTDTNMCQRFEYEEDSNGEIFKCYITNCEKISLPDDFYDYEFEKKLSAEEFSNNANSLLAGVMYMFQLNEKYS